MTRHTLEQKAVIDSNAAVLAVDAFAGTGKTSTLVGFTEVRPQSRTLYIAFNKSVATEAKERFPDHVDCRTTHSLAFGAVGRRYAAKLGNVPAFAVSNEFACSSNRAKRALDTLSAWFCSTDPSVGVEHVSDEVANNLSEAQAVVELAMNVWSRMQDPNCTNIKMPHDGYLKLWAMSRPVLRYDIILLDEAQDTNPITLELVMAQRSHASIVLVGDRHQGIYGFRGAMNAMEAVEADERVALTQSFRFGQAIADVASRILAAFKDEGRAVRGRADIEVQWSVDHRKHYALIGRTNAGLFASAAHVVLGRQPRALHFVGGFESYPFGKVLDAYYLWAEERSRIKDQTIGRFRSFSEFRTYGEEAGDAEVKALCKTVEQYKTQIPTIHSRMRAAETPLQERADITLTTAHRAKGLEWEQVQLADDFIELPPPEDHDQEEINLLYVAVTRAIRAISLPANLSGWLEATGFEFEGGRAELDQQDAVHASGVLGSEDVRLANAVADAARAAGLYRGDELPSLEVLLRLCEELGQGCLEARGHKLVVKAQATA